MTIATQQKRLGTVEAALTPKEWAIRLADQIRSYPSEDDFFRAMAKGTFQDSPVFKPYAALRNQAEERYPGRKPDDINAKVKLNRALRLEYHALKTLILHVNSAGTLNIAITGLRATLKLAKLETIVRQDAFTRTASQAAAWITVAQPTGADANASRQAMLEELAAFTDSIPESDDTGCRFSSDLENWIAEVVALTAESYAQRAAVQTVQDKHFDGHAILFHEVEAGLDENIKTLEDAIATFNAYLKATPGEPAGRLAINTDAIRANAVKAQADRLATNWIKSAKDKAKTDIMSEADEHGFCAFVWDRFRESVGVET